VVDLSNALPSPYRDLEVSRNHVTENLPSLRTIMVDYYCYFELPLTTAQVK